MTERSRAELESKIVNQSHILRILTFVCALLSLAVLVILLVVSLQIQVGNRQILDTLTNALEQNSKQTPTVIQDLHDDSARTQEMIQKICKANNIKC
jgi:predicted PurR-regulated permease PerM